MEKFFKSLSVLALTFSLIACQGEVPSNEEANALALKFVNAVNEGKYTDAFALAGQDYFNARPQERWEEYYAAIQEAMGPVISVKLARKLTDNRLSGRFYIYQFSIKHENGFTKEMVTMIQRINNDDPLRINAHKIDSSKLLKINEMY